MKIDVLGSAMKLIRTMKRRERFNGEVARGTMRLLYLLEKNPDIGQKELADLLEIRPASLSDRLKKMEELSLLQREMDEKDQRKIRISLSEEGKKKLDENRLMRVDDAKLVSDVLSKEEQEMFVMLCEKLISALEKQDTEGGK